MKKRFLSLAIAILILATLFSSCNNSQQGGQSTSSTPPDERTTFTLGFDANFPPYGYQDEDGNYVGFDLDLAAEVCTRRGWELVLQPIDWDAKFMEIDSGNIDCIWNGFTITEERLTEYTWTVPYVDNSQVFVVAKDSGITTKADLAGKIVLVQSDSSAETALVSDEDLTSTFASLDRVPDYNTAFMTLVSGGADAVAMDIGVANYQIEQRQDGSDFVIMEEHLATEQYGIGFKMGNTELRDEVQETLLEMAADGKLAEIAEKWDLTNSVVLGK